MRDIKFRGKRVDNGEWVYGAFVPDALEQTHSDMVSWGFIRRYNGSKSEMIEVDRKTVGEYTGLKDKNWKEIYEGDILRFTQEREAFINTDARIAVEIPKIYYMIGNPYNYSFEVIGNIYENPELLKEVE